MTSGVQLLGPHGQWCTVTGQVLYSHWAHMASASVYSYWAHMASAVVCTATGPTWPVAHWAHTARVYSYCILLSSIEVAGEIP